MPAALAAAVAPAFVLVEVARALSATDTSLTVSLTGSIRAGGSFDGTFEPARFELQDVDRLVVVGALLGTLTDPNGDVIANLARTVSLPVTASGSYRALELTIGPADLDLLGIEVELGETVTTIYAGSGRDELLTNLLRATSHLLDTPAIPPIAISNVLNAVLARL
jgi:hypothetical protein